MTWRAYRGGWGSEPSRRRLAKKWRARVAAQLRRDWKRERGDHRRFRPLPEWVQDMIRAEAAGTVGPAILPTPYWSTVRWTPPGYGPHGAETA